MINKTWTATGCTPRGHDLTLLRELQELTPAERLERHWRMAEFVEELRTAGEKVRATERDLPSSHR
jgi:hypothetical protein